MPLLAISLIGFASGFTLAIVVALTKGPALLWDIGLVVEIGFGAVVVFESVIQDRKTSDLETKQE